MKKSLQQQAQSEIDDLYNLELPDAPDFVSIPSKISLDQAMVLSEEIKKYFPRSVPTQEERWERKVQVEFIL